MNAQENRADFLRQRPTSAQTVWIAPNHTYEVVRDGSELQLINWQTKGERHIMLINEWRINTFKRHLETGNVSYPVYVMRAVLEHAASPNASTPRRQTTRSTR